MGREVIFRPSFGVFLAFEGFRLYTDERKNTQKGDESK